MRSFRVSNHHQYPYSKSCNGINRKCFNQTPNINTKSQFLLFQTTSSVIVFSASNVEACHSFNIFTRVLMFGMDVLKDHKHGVTGSAFRVYFLCFGVILEKYFSFSLFFFLDITFSEHVIVCGASNVISILGCKYLAWV